MHVAYITTEIPRPNQAGYLAYNHALTKALVDRGIDVTIVLGWPRLPAPIVRYSADLDARRVRVVGPGLASIHGHVVVTQPARSLRSLARWAVGLAPGALGERLQRQGRSLDYGKVDAVVGRFLTEDEARAAAAMARGADVVLVDTIFRAPALAYLPHHQPKVVIAHDVFSARHASLRALGLDLFPPTLTEADEARLLAPADLVVAIQAQENAVLAKLAPHARIVTAPMPAEPVARPPGVARQAGRLAFVGSRAPHNVDGLRWFLGEIWPRLRAAMPKIQLDVCGTVGRSVGDVPAGVTVHGIVPDLAPILYRACLAVAPVRAGSGQATKMLDFAAHGLTTVTTTQGLAGYEPTEPWPFIAADTPEAFADAIARLAASDGTKREATASDFLRQYDAAVLLRPFVDSIEALARGQRQAA